MNLPANFTDEMKLRAVFQNVILEIQIGLPSTLDTEFVIPF